MDQAVVPIAAQTLEASATPRAFAQWAAMPGAAKLRLGLGVAALIAIVLALTTWRSDGDYRVLYANLSDKDGGAIIAQLSQLNVPYRFAEGGGAILVPAGQVHDARLKLASAGLPKGSVVGFELMDSARFGQTQFQERLTFQRGLEGELVRSITALSAVENARVHLALPNQNGFFREQQKPSASVMLSLYPGRTLDRAQIAGIVHLVSSSVPELTPKAVSVLDQSGALISGNSESLNNGGLDAQQLQYVAQIENGYSSRIRDILEPILGRDNLRAQVTAEVDFSQSESTSEAYAPNQGAQAQTSVRSQQVSEVNGSSGATPTGVPGAASNQPPVPATAPVTGAVQPLQGAPSGNGAGGASNARRDAVTNYELDKTVRVTRNATGSVKRLNAAVVVNNRSTTDARGKTSQTPIPQEELDKLTALVKEAIGFDERRGDSLKVINAPFRVEPTPPEVELPIWKSPVLLDLLRSAAVPAALGLVALIAFFGLLRPALRTMAMPPPAPPVPQLTAVIDDAEVLPEPPPPSALPAPRSEGKLTEARALAKQNPAAVAAVVRGWVSGEGS